MEIKKYDNGLVELKADAGMALSTYVADNDRIFGDVFILGKNDSIDKYHECTIAERKAYEDEHNNTEE